MVVRFAALQQHQERLRQQKPSAIETKTQAFELNSNQLRPNPVQIEKTENPSEKKVARYQGKRNVFKFLLNDSRLGLRRKAAGREFHTDAEA